MNTIFPTRAEKPKLLSIVSPCYNEMEVAPIFYLALKEVLEKLEGIEYEILFVDDGSKDETLKILNVIMAKDPTVRVLSLSRNFGHQVALTAGLESAVGDAVIMMDSDMQHPPTLIPRLVEKWKEGFDVVSAVRTDTAGVSWSKKFTSQLFYRVLNFLSETQVPAGAADFCLLSRRVCESLCRMPERHRFLRGLISWVGYPRALIHYQSPARAAGESKYSRIKMITLAIDAVLSFSGEPLRLALRAGLLITISGFIYLCWTLIQGYILRQLVPGYASLIGAFMILGGIQLMFLGLIGQYLAHIFEQVKGRPIYLLKQEPPPPRVGCAIDRLSENENRISRRG